MQRQESTIQSASRASGGKGKLALRTKHSANPDQAAGRGRKRDLAMFNLAIDSKLNAAMSSASMSGTWHRMELPLIAPLSVKKNTGTRRLKHHELEL
jgi:hypothetical protein